MCQGYNDIDHRLPWNPGYLAGFLELLKDNLSIGPSGGNESNRLNILMPETMAGTRKATEANAKDYKAFVHVKLNRVVNDPYPISILLLGTHQFIIA
jgi:hypothetical protein